MLTIKPKNKIYFLDWGYYIHSSIYATHPIRPSRGFNPLPSTFVAMRMMLTNLRETGIQPDDIVIIATDKTHISGNWRAELDKEYKSTRKQKREKRIDIDWQSEYGKHNDFEKILKKSTPFYVLGIEKLEADDIISFGVRYFPNNEKIIIASDQDYEQLLCFKNILIYSPKAKRFKVVKNPYKVLQKKIEKEVSDDLRSKVCDEKEFEIRRQIVDLTSLPDCVEQKIEPVFNQLEEKKYNLALLPYNSLRENFFSIYNNANPETFEKSKMFLQKKDRKKKIEKEKKKQLRLV
jgi:hypothetical protein